MVIGAVFIDPARFEEGSAPKSILVVSSSRITGVVLSGIIEKIGLRAIRQAPSELLEGPRRQRPVAAIVDCDGTGCDPAPSEIVAVLSELSPRPLLVAVEPPVPDPALATLFDRIVRRPIVPFALERALAELLIERRPLARAEASALSFVPRRRL